MASRSTTWATAAMIGVLAGLLAWAASATRLGSDLEARSWDWRVRLLSPERPPSDAVVLALDEASLRWLNRDQHIPWPIPRDAWCPLLAELQACGARAVVFDFQFVEETEYDEGFAQCLRATGKTAVGWHCMGDGPALLPSWSVPNAAQGPLRSCLPIVPVAPVLAAATTGGLVDMEPDPDGVIRKTTPLWQLTDKQAFTSLGVAAAMLATGATPTVHDGALHLAGQQLPLDSDGRVLLSWRHKGNELPIIPVKAVYAGGLARQQGLADPFDAARVRDKVVFVAGTAAGTYEFRVTPVAEGAPGVLVHTALYEALRSGLGQREVPVWFAILATVLLAMAIAASVVALDGARTQLLVALGWLAAYLLAAGLGYRHAGLWLPLLAPLLAGLLAFAAGSVMQYRWVGRERRTIRHAFAHYLAPTVIEELVRNPQTLKLGGTRREITAFFSDIRGFTTISESLDPAELVALLNECLGGMTDLLLEQGGTIDKYIGDAVVAMFGAPLPLQNHPLQAARAAIRCQQMLAKQRPLWQARGLPELHVRIGLNTGMALVGNMGSQKRFDYTMIGDTVNLAARLESTAGHYGVPILVSEAVAHRVSDQLLVRELDAVQVKGKHVAVRVYELIGERSTATDKQLQLVETWSRGLQAYRAQQWSEALALWQPLAAAGDGPATTLLARIEPLRQASLPADWDGVFAMTSK